MRRLTCATLSVLAVACQASAPTPPPAPSLRAVRFDPPPVPPGMLPCEPEVPPPFSRIATGGYYCERGLCAASLAQVLANMSDFDGVRVHTEGYLNIGFETNALLASREDFEEGGRNGVGLSMPCDPTLHQFSDLHARRVFVIGRFHIDRGSPLLPGNITVEKIFPHQSSRRQARD